MAVFSSAALAVRMPSAFLTFALVIVSLVVVFACG
jgi:hypothetical protein